jgi:hypothetical protein
MTRQQILFNWVACMAGATDARLAGRGALAAGLRAEAASWRAALTVGGLGL